MVGIDTQMASTPLYRSTNMDAIFAKGCIRTGGRGQQDEVSHAGSFRGIKLVMRWLFVRKIGRRLLMLYKPLDGGFHRLALGLQAVELGTQLDDDLI